MIPSGTDGQIIVFYVIACDSDTDFNNHLDVSCSQSDTHVVYVVNTHPPTVSLINVNEGAYVSCREGFILLLAIDPDGINYDELEVIVNGSSYPSCFTSGDTLYIPIPSDLESENP